MYHYVRDLKNSKYPNIKGLDVKSFKFQINYFKKNYTFIKYYDLIESIYGGKKIPNNSILLTFDDGYIDHYENVFPILYKENIQGCFFPIASPYLFKKVPDVNKIHFILASLNSLEELLKEIFDSLNNFRSEGFAIESNEKLLKNLAIANRDDTKEVVFLKRLLQHGLPLDLRSELVDKLFKKYVTNEEKIFINKTYMSKNQLSEMQTKGMIFGNHSCHHLWLDKINKKEQIFEIETGLNFLESFNGLINDWSISYPHGGYNKSLLKVCNNLNCKLGLTTNTNISKLNFENRLTLERIDTNEFPKTV